MADPKKLTKIKSSLFQRSFSMAKLTFNTGAGIASHKISTLLSSSETRAEKWTDFLRSQAKEFSTELGELKGSLMKAGQMLSMYGEHFLPPEANEMLKSLRSQSPPVDWNVMRLILETELGADKLSLLEIEPEAIGSASLGQVHKARILATDQWIVLKIQYPGVEKAIDSDLKALRSFLSMAKLLPKALASDHIFSEVRSMLIQEVDYRQEADFTEQYAQKLGPDSRFVIPKVFREFSTGKVLATSFERGIESDDTLVKNLSQERRNRLALNYLDLYFTELFEWGLVQTDPHAGNYKVRLDAGGSDQLVLLDFGAVRAYPSEFLKSYRQMIQASINQDLILFEQAAIALKFLGPEDDPEIKKVFFDFCQQMIEPFREDKDYDYKKTDLPQRLTKKGFEMIQRFSLKLRSPPREVLFLDRKTGGAFIFCSMMGAKINGRPLLLKYLNKPLASL